MENARWANIEHTMVLADENGWTHILRPEDPRLNGQEVSAFVDPSRGTLGDVPQKITRMQARTQMMRHRLPDGSILDDRIQEALEGAVALTQGLPDDDPVKRDAIENLFAFNNANELERKSRIVATIGAAFGLDDAMLDRLFRAAARIEK